ncbi:MAG TPA: chemotaxis protein CheB [Candidatus Dormibacteraeota bacterium]|nr:chemotaxis protein CheB [Candidatus Dormibacteraeota bacterium]
MTQELVDRKGPRSKTKSPASRQRRGFRPIQSAPHRKPKTIDHGTLVDESFQVVGIGASAGGLEAFTLLLRELPPDINMALVLIQHLDPTYKSLLTELLSKTTKLPVTEVTDGMQVKPRHVYVIPPNTSMTISKGALHLTPRVEVDRKHMPIDHFLQSLSLDQKGRAIGVILSGTSMDGVQGLKAIKAEGGITIAQDEKSAKYYDLPRSAVAAGFVDIILAPKEIAQELTRISEHPYVPYLETDKAEELLPQSDLEKIFSLLRRGKGVDFTDYKHATIKRRILRRMLILKINRMENYLKYLQTNPSELNSLFQDILINVTAFFREPATLEALKTEIFPNILKNRPAEDPIRIWIPGCSTGEEVYSVAMNLLEYLDNTRIKPPIQIFATDVNENVLEKARQGVYSASPSISAERLRRFFAKTNGSYQINKTIRKMCIFAKQNVTADPPFSKLDLIVCRNLLIYLGPPLQKKLLPIFHYALKPTGFLVLGEFETIGEFDNIFSVANKRLKIYSKKPMVPRTPLDFSMKYGIELGHVDRTEARPIEGLVPEQAIFKEADRILLTKYSPATVIVNSDLEIIQFRGRTGLFLEPAPGKASLNVLKMAREGLMTNLRAAIDRAKTSGDTVRKKEIAIKSDGKYIDVNLEVVPLKTSTNLPYLLIAFEEALPRPIPGPTTRGARGAKYARDQMAEDRKFLRLEQELSANKEYLQSIIQDNESAIEELRAANEEIQSSNEELQSTNEELETAKEELQSTNEELTTVNEELQNRNVELTQVNDDITNLLVSANLPIIMLGNDLRIRRFTPHAEKMFNLLATDVGRSIIDINMNPKTPDMSSLITDVIDSVTPQEIEVKDNNGRWYSIWIRPYRTADNKIDGAVIAFVDIDRIKQAEEKLRAHTEQLEEVVEERTRMLRNSTRMAAIGETAGMVGHDLRNPLQTIINTIHLATESVKSGAAPQNLRIEKTLETIREQADFMNKIVSDLQDYARQPKPSLVEYDLQGLIDDTLSSISIPKSVEVSTSLEPGFPKLTVDPNLLRRAFTNIIANALQAMPDGGQLKIRGWKNKEVAAISFQDTGKGIPEDIKAKIFNPLFTTREKGVGLGLAASKMLIESHHGDIKVSSKAGEGTTFTVEIPLDRKM